MARFAVFAFILAALGGAVALADDPPPGEDLCAFARTATEAELLSADPLNEHPCDPWDALMWADDVRECTYTCGAVVHVEAM